MAETLRMRMVLSYVGAAQSNLRFALEEYDQLTDAGRAHLLSAADLETLKEMAATVRRMRIDTLARVREAEAAEIAARQGGDFIVEIPENPEIKLD
jgi:hypothetical protein